MSADLFALADADDAAGLLAALGPERSPSRQRNSNGESLVLYCRYRGRTGCLDALLGRSGDVTLHEAAALGLMPRLDQLIADAPWAVDTLSADGWGALHLAGFFNQPAAVRRLLDAGADAGLWARAFERNLALHAACASKPDKPEIVRLLVAATPDIEALQGQNWTPLMLAAANGHAESVALLLAAGADRRRANAQGQTAEQLARAAGHETVAVQLG